MAYFGCLCLVLLLSVNIAHALDIFSTTTNTQRTVRHPASDFTRHTLVEPRIYHGREKRQISSSREKENRHLRELTIALDIDGEEYILDLSLNNHLIPKGFFHRYQEKGKTKVHRPNPEEIDLCHYNGRVRGKPNSWVALSTCDGLSGLFFDGIEMHYIEKDTKVTSGNLETKHFLYKHSDLAQNNKTCGFESSPFKIEHPRSNRMMRYKRYAEPKEPIKGPYNATMDSKFLEFILVVDNREYRELGENTAKVAHHCISIANIINGLYSQLNIYIALIGVVIWTEHDEISFSENGDTTLTNFLHYRREKLIPEHPNDNAQLLTKFSFMNGVVGKALKGPICTYEYSGGINSDHSPTVGLVASTIAHEIGHNFGMEHDTTECECPEEKCIMSPSSSSVAPLHWSSCSLKYLLHAFTHGMDYCLKNKPESIFDSPICGNGFVEPGEECDCGLPDNCGDNCCNPYTCRLHSNATCATGSCCDLETCTLKSPGTVCRAANYECDLPEYCTGESEYCPADVFKMNSLPCGGGKAYCFDGLCRTRSDQCKLIWGETGASSGDQCYQMNIYGNRTGNCGYNRLTKVFHKCNAGDVFCGMLQCKHLNERLEFGIESAALLSHSFINLNGVIVPCRTAVIDLGINVTDPGLTPNGARCGTEKMCVNQKCVTLESFRSSIPTCPNNCSGNGVCNSFGHCHCFGDFAPPLCDTVGVGGSIDSGPSKDPQGHVAFRNTMYIIFLGIVPLILILLFLWYYARERLGWKKPSPPMSKSPGKSRGLGFQPPPAKRTEDNHSLLQPETIVPPPVDFFGHFKGFSLTPIKKTEPEPVRSAPPPPYTPNAASVAKTEAEPVRSAPVPPSYNQTVTGTAATISRASPVKAPVVSSSVTAKNSFLHKPSLNKTPSFKLPFKSNTNISQAPALPPPNPGSTAKPIISSPILENSTCTAKELISPLKSVSKVPLRPAPTVPPMETVENKRPLSSPEVSFNAIVPVPINSDSEVKKSVNNTISRITSFLKPADKKPSGMTGNTGTLNRNQIKANKIDKDTLRNIEISNPILQTEIDIGVASLPVDSAENKAVVMRAQSMRGGKVTPRPQIQTFGSMRQPGYKRPVSIPSGVRPKSPPPRPPGFVTKAELSKDIQVSNNQYDDCLNKASPTKIGQQASNDNIYSVIEESPVSPVPVKNSSNSDENIGLLGEIVSEIQNRNVDSIYSTSTLGRKKKEQENLESQKNDQTTSNSDLLYENTSSICRTPESVYSNMNSGSSSCGYIQPDAINAPVKLPDNNKGADNGKETSLSTFKTVKPLSTFTKPANPAEHIYNNTSQTPPKSANERDSKFSNLRTKTPSPTSKSVKSLARQTTPPNLRSRKASPTRKAPSPTSKSNRSVTNSPDLVTSCNAKPSSKPPDVLSGGPISKKPSVSTKPMVNGLPKGQSKFASKAANLKSLQEKKGIEVKPPVANKINKDSNSVKTTTTGVKAVSRQNSNVASLQQKFENKTSGDNNNRMTVKSKA